LRRLVDHLGGLLPILLLPLGLVGLLVVVSRPDLANQLESWIETQLRSMESPAAQMSLLSLGTFVSEDLTSIGAGILASTGNIALWVAVLGCFLGIFLGDMSLWFVGRLFRPWLNRGRLGVRLGRFGRWLDREGWWAILASRFMPGTRTPLYLAGGAATGKSHLLQAACHAAASGGRRPAYLPLSDESGLHPDMLEGLEALD